MEGVSSHGIAAEDKACAATGCLVTVVAQRCHHRRRRVRIRRQGHPRVRDATLGEVQLAAAQEEHVAEALADVGSDRLAAFVRERRGHENV